MSHARRTIFSMEDTWFSRDLLVLDAAVRLKEEDPTLVPGSKELAEATGLPGEEVRRSLRALVGEYLDGESMADGDYSVEGIRPEARRAAGQWPTPENVADRLLATLEQAAEQEADPDEKGRLRRAADSLKGLGRDVLPEVIANAITKGAMGL